MRYIQFHNEKGEYPGMITSCNDFIASALPEGVSQEAIADDVDIEGMMVDLKTLELVPADFPPAEQPPRAE